MGKLEELSKFLEYPSNMLENTSQLIWNIPVTYWKFPVGSKMILVFFGMLMTFKNSEKTVNISLHVSALIYGVFESHYYAKKHQNHF